MWSVPSRRRQVFLQRPSQGGKALENEFPAGQLLGAGRVQQGKAGVTRGIVPPDALVFIDQARRAVDGPNLQMRGYKAYRKGRHIHYALQRAVIFPKLSPAYRRQGGGLAAVQHGGAAHP